MRYYEIVHALGIHSWDLPALLVFVILMAVLLGHHHKQKQRTKEFEKKLHEKIQEIRRTGEEKAEA